MARCSQYWKRYLWKRYIKITCNFIHAWVILKPSVSLSVFWECEMLLITVLLLPSLSSTIVMSLLVSSVAFCLKLKMDVISTSKIQCISLTLTPNCIRCYATLRCFLPYKKYLSYTQYMSLFLLIPFICRVLWPLWSAILPQWLSPGLWGGLNAKRFSGVLHYQLWHNVQM